MNHKDSTGFVSVEVLKGACGAGKCGISSWTLGAKHNLDKKTTLYGSVTQGVADDVENLNSVGFKRQQCDKVSVQGALKNLDTLSLLANVSF